MGHAWKATAGSPTIDDVVTWTEPWEVGNIHSLWPPASPSLLNHYNDLFSTLTSDVADAYAWRSRSIRRTQAEMFANEREGNRHCW